MMSFAKRRIFGIADDELAERLVRRDQIEVEQRSLHRRGPQRPIAEEVRLPRVDRERDRDGLRIGRLGRASGRRRRRLRLAIEEPELVGQGVAR